MGWTPRGCVTGVAVLAWAAFAAWAGAEGPLPQWDGLPGTERTVHDRPGGEILEWATQPSGGASFTRFYTYGVGAVQAYRAGRAAPLWAEGVAVTRRPLLLYTDEQVAVVATGYELIAIEAAAGRVVWRVGAEPDGLQAVGADPEEFPRERFFACDGGRVLAVRSDRQARTVELGSGRVLWTNRLAHLPAGPVRFAGERFVYPAIVDGQSAVCVCGAERGAQTGLLPAVAGQTLIGVLPADGDRLVLVSVGAIAVHAFDRPEPLWVHPVRVGLGPDRVLLAGDAIYLSPDGYSLQKLSLADGRVLWESAGERIGRAAAVALADFGDRLVLATGDGARLLAADDGGRLAQLSLTDDQAVDRWGFTNDGLIGRRGADSALALLWLNPADAARFADPPARRYAWPAGRIDAVVVLDGALVVSGGGVLVSYRVAASESAARGS